MLTWCIEEIVSISMGVYSHRSVCSISEIISNIYYTVVSRASAHSRVSVHVLHFKGLV